jgi:hypothetical protein
VPKLSKCARCGYTLSRRGDMCREKDATICCDGFACAERQKSNALMDVALRHRMTLAHAIVLGSLHAAWEPKKRLACFG